MEDDDWIMVNCKTCKIPMLVYKKHVKKSPKSLRFLKHMFEKYVEAKHAYYYVDCRMRKIPNHFHCHYRLITNQ